MRPSLPGLQHFILFGVLVAFSLAIWEEPSSLIGRVWWLVGCGLSLLWQPVISADRRLSPVQVALVFVLVGAVVLRLDWAWLAASVILVAALVGGKVIVARERRLGWYYLLAFAYLCVLLFVWISPRLYAVVPTDGVGAWSRWLSLGALIAVALALPLRRVDEGRRVFDFLVSLLILMMLASVLMAVGIMIALDRVSHAEALVRALIGLGGAVLALNWIWNPRLGFSGLGPMVSRYLLRFGFPFEDWLNGIANLFDREPDPDVFLEKALKSFAELPWVVGGEIRRGAAILTFGEHERHRAELRQGELELVLFTSYAWSASLIWQANLLFKLAVEFYRARQREHLLRQMQYVQAVYETGSRVTHDVKNLLQSLEGLCFAVDGKQVAADDHEVMDLMRRQLPEISRRLRSTLEKLAAPSGGDADWVCADEWWQAVQGRFDGQRLGFANVSPIGRHWIPGTLFDTSADNLIANALQKRLHYPGLKIAVILRLEGGEAVLRVEDDGDPVPEGTARALFAEPVYSSNGLGVGLFHAGQLAARLGFRLALTENRPGAVAFSLSGPARDQSPALAISG